MVHSVPPEQRRNQHNGDSVCFLLSTAKTAMKMESVAPASRLQSFSRTQGHFQAAKLLELKVAGVASSLFRNIISLLQRFATRSLVNVASRRKLVRTQPWARAAG